MTETNPMTNSEVIKKQTYVKVVNEHISLIAMPYEIVLSILRAASGTIADPSIFGKEHREEVHKQLNELIEKTAPPYTLIDIIV